jgi:hypothetical protein
MARRSFPEGDEADEPAYYVRMRARRPRSNHVLWLQHTLDKTFREGTGTTEVVTTNLRINTSLTES